MEQPTNNIPPPLTPQLPQPPPLLVAPPRKPRWFRRIALALGLVVAISAFCYVLLVMYLGRANPVILVSGINKPYTVSIDGIDYAFKPGESVLRIKLAEGTHTVRAKLPVPGKEIECNETFEINTPFWTRPFKRVVTFINPDKIAIVADKNMFFVKYGGDTTAYTPEEGAHIYPNRVVMQLPMPDLLMNDPPPAVPARAQKFKQTTWAGIVPVVHPYATVALIEKLEGHKAAFAWLMQCGLLAPESRVLCAFANTYFSPGEADLFYKQHLETRPVQVVWHRHYQDYVRSQPPANVMNTYYRSLLQTNPTDGALLYVIGRGITRARNYEDTDLYMRSLRADNPCPYAWYTLAGDAQDNMEFALALSRVRRAMAENVDIAEIPQLEREALLALGRNEEAEQSAEFEYKQNPLNFERATEYLSLIGLNKKTIAERDKAVRIFDDALGENTPYRYKADCKAILQAAYAYGTGDENQYCFELLRVSAVPLYAFNVALTRGNHKRAFEVMDVSMRTNFCNWLLLYIVAREKGDEADATRYFAEALDAMRLSSRGARRMAQELAETGDADHRSLIRSQFSPQVKPILFCALGWHSTKQREIYFYWAGKTNVLPGFPRLLLTRSMQCANSYH